MNRKISDEASEMSLVWTILPIITAIIPSIGHTGITSSQGVIHDFQFPSKVSTGSKTFFLFGPLKRVRIDCDPQEWDNAIIDADREFKSYINCLCTHNCHDHLAAVLNRIRYRNQTWGTLAVWWLLFTESEFTSYKAIFITYAQSLIMIIALVITLAVVLN